MIKHISLRDICGIIYTIGPWINQLAKSDKTNILLATVAPNWSLSFLQIAGLQILRSLPIQLLVTSHL